MGKGKKKQESGRKGKIKGQKREGERKRGGRKRREEGKGRKEQEGERRDEKGEDEGEKKKRREEERKGKEMGRRKRELLQVRIRENKTRTSSGKPKKGEAEGPYREKGKGFKIRIIGYIFYSNLKICSPGALFRGSPYI